MGMIRNEVDLFLKFRIVWIYLGTSDLWGRFRHSKLGLLWPIMHQLAFSLGGGIIWASVFKLPPEEFIPFMTLGFSIWIFISNVMTEGCLTLINAHGYLKQLPLPQSIFIFRTMFVQLLMLSIGLMTALGVLLFFGKLQLLGLFLATPGIIILFLFSYGAVGSLAYLGFRFRDLQHGLAGVLSLLFVVTPVIYPAEVLVKKGLAIAIYSNPFASLIEIIRFPILNGELASPIHYLLSSLFALGLVSLRFHLGSRWSRFVPYWS